MKVLDKPTKTKISVIRGNNAILNWIGKLQHILQPGRIILDTLNGLSERNHVLRMESANQGVEFLILSQTSRENERFDKRVSEKVTPGKGRPGNLPGQENEGFGTPTKATISVIHRKGGMLS